MFALLASKSILHDDARPRVFNSRPYARLLRRISRASNCFHVAKRGARGNVVSRCTNFGTETNVLRRIRPCTTFLQSSSCLLCTCTWRLGLLVLRWLLGCIHVVRLDDTKNRKFRHRIDFSTIFFVFVFGSGGCARAFGDGGVARADVRGRGAGVRRWEGR